MSNYSEIFRSLTLRGILGVPLFIGGTWMLFRGNPLGCALIIVAAVVLAGPIARLIAEPSGSLFYPNLRADRPGPVYGIPAAKRARGLYEESIAGYQQIAAEFPDEVKPHVQIIDICIRDLKDPTRANQVFQDGLAALRREEDREALARMYAAIRTRLNSRPSN
jgi:hypothetical protein